MKFRAATTDNGVFWLEAQSKKDRLELRKFVVMVNKYQLSNMVSVEDDKGISTLQIYFNFLKPRKNEKLSKRNKKQLRKKTKSTARSKNKGRRQERFSRKS